MTKLDDAIASILAASQPTGCWASRLEGDAKKLVDRLREEERKGIKVSRTATQRVLAGVFSLRVSDSAIRSHLTGVCQCQ